MKKFFSRKYIFALLIISLLAGGDAFVLLKAFVLPQVSQVVATETTASDMKTESSTKAKSTATSYSDDNIQITVNKKVVADTNVFVVDIKVSDPKYLQTAFAKNTYGRNIKEKTSVIAKAQSSILAINGDYYGFRNTGYVIRNGKLYRDTATSGQEDLVINSEGDFSIISEEDVSAKKLLKNGAKQLLSFGPSLIENSKITVDSSTEVSQSMQSNPRTAIAQLGKNHYAFVVSEGRTSDSAGLSLYQLAQVMKDLGAKTAYNLDGGGSSTLYFNGKVLNKTVGGQGESERSVSDIVSIGY